jgi:threonine dehydrogenase-like Zn-dependent dehydrogenase
VVHGLLEITPPRVGDVVVVQGAGPVGLASAMYAKLAGAAKVVLVGGPASGLELALDLGACDVALDIFQVPDAAERTTRVLAETTAGRGADLVVEATGAPHAVGEGLDLCRKNGWYLVVGQYTDHGLSRSTRT